MSSTPMYEILAKPEGGEEYETYPLKQTERDSAISFFRKHIIACKKLRINGDYLLMEYESDEPDADGDCLYEITL